MSEVERTPPRILLGTMTLGGQADEANFKEQLKLYLNSNSAGKQLDTAHVYQKGETERLLGELLKSESFDTRSSECKLKPEGVVFSLASKANIRAPPHLSLSGESVRYQLEESLKRLGVSQLDLFYLHGPDINTPIEETLKACNDLFREGKFKHFGLSNYPAWKVMEIYHLCKRNNWIVPTIYQGHYNAIVRDIETELLPCLRTCGIALVVYNPLAGGLLTGKYSSMSDEALTKSGRYSSAYAGSVETPSPEYRIRYFHEEIFQALELIRKSCEQAKISMTDASLRWLMHHSYLNGNYNDGIIIGASKTEHIVLNLKASAAPPLPTELVKSINNAWEIARKSCPGYFRGYDSVNGQSFKFLERFGKPASS